VVCNTVVQDEELKKIVKIQLEDLENTTVEEEDDEEIVIIN